jgi:hypothetical protein
MPRGSLWLSQFYRFTTCTVTWVDPGKKALLQSNMEYEAILIDTSETPIERQKSACQLLTVSILAFDFSRIPHTIEQTLKNIDD